MATVVLLRARARGTDCPGRGILYYRCARGDPEGLDGDGARRHPQKRVE